jgi:hypothetical protein
MRDNEKVIEEVYTNQLYAILFSINQYSDDVLNSWLIEFNQIFDDLNSPEKDVLNSYLNELAAVKMVIRFDLKGNLLQSAQGTVLYRKN